MTTQQPQLFNSDQFLQMENGVREGHLLVLIYQIPKFKVAWYPVDEIIDQWTFKSGPFKVSLSNAKFKKMVNLSKQLGEQKAQELKALYDSGTPEQIITVEQALIPIIKQLNT